MRTLIAASLLALAPSLALAQGYDVRIGDAPLLVRPDDATRLVPDADTGIATVRVTFRFYGARVDSLDVSLDGWARPTRDGPLPDSPPERLPAAPGSPADGVITPSWADAGPPGSEGADGVQIHTWTFEPADERAVTPRFVVEWSGLRAAGGGTITTQLVLNCPRDAIELRSDARAITGVTTGAATVRHVRGIDEPGGGRFTAAGEGGEAGREQPLPFVALTPRTVVHAPIGVGAESIPVAWIDTRKESVIPDGCTSRCTYLGKGLHYFHVADRARREWNGTRWKGLPASRRERLVAEDRATFGGDGDDFRWVRQVLDGKVLLLRADGGPPLRVWFRIVEYFSIDDRALAGADYHNWNIRWMLSNALPGDDPREDIERYHAWKASARGRLTVGKLFAASQRGDAGAQFDSGRKREYELWSGRVTTGTRGALAPYAAAPDSWARFVLMEEDMRIDQHADTNDLRFVPDPNYVDGEYEYTIRADDNDDGWVHGRTLPSSPLREEGIDVDPGRVVGPETPK